MFWSILLVTVNILVASCSDDGSFSVLDKIKAGFKMAGSFFSSDHSNKVANLVSTALGKTHTKPSPEVKTNNIFSGFLRLFGLSPKKIGAIAVNAIIVVAQLISSSISLTPPSELVQSKGIKNESPLDWVLSNPAIADLLADVKDDKLADKVIEHLTERSLDEDSGCMQLLICKSTPFIKGMQEQISSSGGEYVRKQDIPFQFFPTVEEVAENGDRCERKYNYCRIPL
ncbi:uncharacterized protein isoform X1 [Leptinotarsa decemlineata]|uniref:uncharacterized protein isoform X1 n=2 Tax=Leptinotarsa decemlineata TaxID=7539 RepID=UPI003D308864